eukprot:PhM_4_TR10096/c2_g2_i1/m.19630
MDNFLRAHEDLGMRDPTPLQRKTFGVLEKWMRATGAITGWNDCATYTELGDAIVELLRYQHVDRYSGGQADTFFWIDVTLFIFIEGTSIKYRNCNFFSS